MTIDSAIPSAPGELPVLGHAVRLRRDPLRFLESMPADSGLVRYRVGPKELLMVCDSDLTRRMLIDDRTFDKGGPINALVQTLVGDGLATCPRSRHRGYRRLIQPVLDPARFPRYAETTSAGIDVAIGDWRDGQVLDMPVEMRRLGIHAAVRTWFSGALSPAEVDRTADDFTTILIGFAQRVGRPPVLNRLPTPSNRRHTEAIARLRQTLGDVIADRRASATDQDDLLTALLTPAGADGPAMTDSVAIDHATTFIAAPTATIASSLGWVFHLLAHHPGIADRLHSEVDSVLAGAPAGFEHLPELELTQRIVTETLRLYPTLWLGTRVVTADTHLGGHLLPAGTILSYSPYLVGRSDLYDNPDRFDPDRWDPSLRPAPPRHAFVPFGGGARQCIANQYAPMEMVLAVATIAARWQLDPVPGRPLRPRAAANLTARGLRLRAVRRTLPLKEDHSAPAGLGGRADRAQAGTQRPTRRASWLL
jgi:pentalenene oxygenase